jgi:hypothetical protein
MATIPFVWSNDDITVGQSEKLQRQVEFLGGLGIPGTFFVIPRAGERTIAEDAELLRTIERARGQGHEFYQHGYVHTPYESGIPELGMLDFSPEVKAQYDLRRFELEATHTVEALARMAHAGQAIWRRAFHEDSPGYRPGWGAFCGNLYRALDVLGYAWVSSRLPCMTSWQWNLGKWDAPIHFRAEVPQRPGPAAPGCRVVELPLTGGDYGFAVPNEADKIARMVELGRQEFAWCHERGIAFQMVSHWHGLERNGDTGYAVHRQLLPKVQASGQARFITTGQWYAEVQAHA